MRQALLVAFGGAVGSVARWMCVEWAARHVPGPVPWGTLLVNVVGSLWIGIIATIADSRSFGAPETRLLVVTGVLGGFTTFSALSWETLNLARGGAVWIAAVYATGSVLIGLVAAALGRALALRVG